MKRGLEKETYRLLKRSSDLVVARLKESDQMEDEGFFFYLSNFSIFGLAGISTFRELVDIIDPHGEICEGKGYRQYQEELLKTMHRSEENHKKLSFLLPILNQDKFKDYQFSLSAAFGMVHLEYGENGAFNLSNNLQAIRLADYAMYQAKASHQRLRLIETKEAKTLLNDRDIEQKIHSLISQIRR